MSLRPSDDSVCRSVMVRKGNQQHLFLSNKHLNAQKHGNRGQKCPAWHELGLVGNQLAYGVLDAPPHCARYLHGYVWVEEGGKEASPTCLSKCVTWQRVRSSYV